jgi:hypothetical protein
MQSAFRQVTLLAMINEFIMALNLLINIEYWLFDNVRAEYIFPITTNNESSPRLVDTSRCANTAQMYFPGTRPIGSQFDIAP